MTGELTRYTLYFRGTTPDPSDIALLRSTPNVRVIDHEVERLVLIETDEPTFQRLRQLLPTWSMAPETTYSRPEPQ